MPTQWALSARVPLSGTKCWFLYFRISDAYCFELLSMVLALSGSAVGRAYLAQQLHLIQDLLSLLHTSSPRVQRQVKTLLYITNIHSNHKHYSTPLTYTEQSQTLLYTSNIHRAITNTTLHH